MITKFRFVFPWGWRERKSHLRREIKIFSFLS